METFLAIAPDIRTRELYYTISIYIPLTRAFSGCSAF